MFKINNKNLISFRFITLFTFVLSFLILLPTDVKALYYEDWINGTYSGYNSNSNHFENDYYYEDDYNQTINPVPSIYSISPNSVNKNTDSVVTIRGYGFTRNSIVRLDGYTLNATFINSSTLRTRINSYDSTQGGHFVSVFNPAPGGGYSNSIIFTVKNMVNTNTKSNNTSNNTSTTNTKTKNTGIISDSSKEKLNETSDLAGNAIFGSNGFLPSSVFQWIFFFILILLGVILWRKLYVNEEERHTPLKHA